jgi:hypothetical protein
MIMVIRFLLACLLAPRRCWNGACGTTKEMPNVLIALSQRLAHLASESVVLSLPAQWMRSVRPVEDISVHFP